jgi:hypothetical protein
VPKNARQWYENALLITIAGSIIVVVGQLAGTVIPIMYGPADISDFIVSTDPIGDEYNRPYNDSPDTIYLGQAVIKVDEIHPHLRPYRFNVRLQTVQSPKGMNITIKYPELKPPYISYMQFDVPKSIPADEYEIIIQGLGGDGRKHNTTFYLKINDVGGPPQIIFPFTNGNETTKYA